MRLSYLMLGYRYEKKGLSFLDYKELDAVKNFVTISPPASS